MSAATKAIGLIVTYPLQAVAFAALLGIFFKSITARSRNPNGLPLPPGPKGWPIIGNLFDMPRDKPWVVYHEWFKVYGDMIYFEVLGQPFLILGSLKRTSDLFEKRSTNYSDRLRMPMVLELMHWDYNMAMLPYGTWWRRHRRAFNEYFHQNVVSKYQPTQSREVRAFLHRLLISPDKFMHHIRHTFAATIMSVAYGISVKDSDDPYISRAEEALEGLAEAGIPGSYLVDIIPLLKHVPSWFPGAGFKRKAAHWRVLNHEVSELPFEYVEDQVKKGTAVPSVAAALIDHLPDKDHPLYAEERRIAQDTAAVAYVGGADTTVSSVQAFFLAMALYPEVQRRAQTEIDAVVGNDRLPDFSDRDALPYVNALVKETVRWNLVIPMAVGHMCSEDDEYDGYFIPKGTVVIGNGWYYKISSAKWAPDLISFLRRSILHDPTVFSRPMEFHPEHYLRDGKLDPNARNPDCAAFGYGRRICPGRYMSDNSLYAIISCVLAVYDIKPAVDGHGNVVKLKPEFTSGLLSYPVPFQCSITPRSALAESLIRDCIEIDH